jgi:hypothetical protein
MAVNWSELLIDIVGLCGVISNDDNVAFVTVRGVFAETPLAEWVTVIVADPAFTAVVSPCVPAALLTVAISVSEELQVTWEVMSRNELSE